MSDEKVKPKITTFHIFTYAIIGLCLLLLVYIVYNHEQERKNPHALQVLEKRYEDSLMKVYGDSIKIATVDKQQREKRIAILRDSVNSFQAQLNENDNDITQIQHQAGVKILRVNTLSTDSLTTYFLSLIQIGYVQNN